jgi:electron transfer flavoprotein alpha subunit
VGFQRAKQALAVNPDPHAPVFQHVDVGIVGRWEEVLPVLVNELAPILALSIPGAAR